MSDTGNKSAEATHLPNVVYPYARSPHPHEGVLRAVEGPSLLHWGPLQLTPLAGLGPFGAADNWQTSCTPALQSSWSPKPDFPAPKQHELTRSPSLEPQDERDGGNKRGVQGIVEEEQGTTWADTCLQCWGGGTDDGAGYLVSSDVSVQEQCTQNSCLRRTLQTLSRGSELRERPGHRPREKLSLYFGACQATECSEVPTDATIWALFIPDGSQPSSMQAPSPQDRAHLAG